MDSLKQFVLDFLFLFAMVNVLGNLPVISHATDHLKRRQRDKVFNIAVLAGGLIAATLAFLGYVMLMNVFGVSTNAIKIAAGIWIFIVALYGIIRGTNQIFVSKIKSKNLAYIPMSIPFLAGPGTVAAIMLLILSEGWILASLIIFLVYLAVLPLLQLTPLVKNASGKIWTTVIARVLYALVGAKSISLILSGLQIEF